jgi:FAD/FMN-containing dehydrogenase
VARVSAGLETWELYTYMDLYDMAVVAPAAGSTSGTIGAYGGFMAGGGHSVLASYYGLGADQTLSLQVVTADGRFVTADPQTNEDIFYALRGGGPGKPHCHATEHLPLSSFPWLCDYHFMLTKQYQ